MTALVISVSVKVNVTIGLSRTFRTKGGRKQAIQTPSVRRTLGCTIPAEPLEGNPGSPRLTRAEKRLISNPER